MLTWNKEVCCCWCYSRFVYQQVYEIMHIQMNATVQIVTLIYHELEKVNSPNITRPVPLSHSLPWVKSTCPGASWLGLKSCLWHLCDLWKNSLWASFSAIRWLPGTEVLTNSSFTCEGDDWQSFHSRELVKQDKHGCSVDVCSKGQGWGTGANGYCPLKGAEDHLIVHVK